MVGKVWSDREEKYFWRSAVGNSPKRIGIDLAKPEKSWDQLARDMQRDMGENARRNYTGTMLFEHYFQNIESQRKSPHAVVYVFEYLKKLGPHRQPPDMEERVRYLTGATSRSVRRRRLAKKAAAPAAASVVTAAAGGGDAGAVAPLGTGTVIVTLTTAAAATDAAAVASTAAAGPGTLDGPGKPVPIAPGPLPDFNAQMPKPIASLENILNHPQAPVAKRSETTTESLFVGSYYDDDELEDGEIRE